MRRSLRSLPGLRDPAALRAFVIAVTIRTGKYQARRARTRVRVEGYAAFSQLVCGRQAREDVHVQHTLVRVDRLLQRIRERDRCPFVLRFIEGMKDDEVARVLAISVPTVRRRCARAHERFNYLAQRDLFLAAYPWGSSFVEGAQLRLQFLPGLVNPTPNRVDGNLL